VGGGVGDKVENKGEKEQNSVRDGCEEDEEVKEKFGEIDFFFHKYSVHQNIQKNMVVRRRRTRAVLDICPAVSTLINYKLYVIIYYYTHDRCRRPPNVKTRVLDCDRKHINR